MPETEKPSVSGGHDLGRWKPKIIGEADVPEKTTKFQPKVIDGHKDGQDAGSSSPPKQTPKPTIVDSGEKSKKPILPKVVSSQAAPKAAGQEHQKMPMVIPSASAQPSEQVRKPVIAGAPTVLPGVVRKAVKVEVKELRVQFPGTQDEILENVKKILAMVVLDCLVEKDCIFWATKIQERYGELVNEMLELTGNSVVRDNSRHLARLYGLLQEIAQTFEDHDKPGLAFWKKWQSPIEKFTELSGEIDQISAVLRAALADIVDVQSKIRKNSQEFALLASSLEAESFAASYLSNSLMTIPAKQDMSQLLLSRGQSLLQTVVQIRQGEINRQSAISDIGELISKIQDGVLVTLPAWIEQINVARTKKLTNTDFYTIRSGLENVVDKVKKTTT